MVMKILYPPILENDAITYGRLNEKNARECLQKEINKQIRSCGLFIERKLSYLGASTDGLIDDEGIVEIKCSFTGKDLSAKEVIEAKLHLRRIFGNRKMNKTMNKRYNYYYQVQGQLQITQRQYCLFSIWTPKSIVTIRVERDDEFWHRQMETKLVRFYEYCLFPEILDRRKNRNMQIRDPPYFWRHRRKRELKRNRSKAIN
ncbi:uncharacterized protein [Prorops nasuta]|uniref:uncharacterized protein n=1 Tax=Prorops nasuta TaxID=863751 RepID=UPI0034CE009F